MQPIAHTPEAGITEKEEIASLREEIKQLCNRVPASVLAGSHNTAVAWKKAASDAYKLATSAKPTLTKLHDARQAMQLASRG